MRLTAVRSVAPRTSGAERVKLLAPLLVDDVTSVRLVTAIRLAGSPAGLLQDYQREALDASLGDFAERMERSLDRPFAAFNLGNLYMSFRDTARAEPYFRKALEIDDSYYPAALNLAVLLNSRGDNEEAAALLRQILMENPDLHEADHALAQVLTELGSYEEAAAHLRRAARAMPQRPRIHYELGQLEQMLGQGEAAEAALLRALAIEPDNLDYLYALASQYVLNGNLTGALEIADRMIASHPESDMGRQVKIQVEWALQPRPGRSAGPAARVP
ncbi:MAG: tetratricopeptide repeat protein [Gemmatimonadales bacterium]